MAFADTSTYTLAYALESTFDNAVTGAGVYTLLRNTGESLNTSLESAQSDEIDSTRQMTGSVHVSGSSAGSVNLQLSYGEYDEFLQSVLQSPNWTVGYSDTSTNIASNVLTVTSTTGLKPGHLVKLAGLTVTAEDGVYTVLKVISGTTFSVVETLTDEAVATVAVTNSGVIENGSTFRSYTFEKDFQVGGASNYFVMSGMVPASMSLSLSSGSIISGEIAFQGATGSASATSKDTGTYIASQTNELMNSVSNVSGISFDAVALDGTLTPISATFQELSVSLNNNLREQTAVGNLFAAGIGSGRIQAEATATVYFENRGLFDKFLANDSVQIKVKINDNSGNTYGLAFPEMKVSSHEVVASGPDSDVMASVSFSGIKDSRSGTGKTVMITRVV